MKNMKKKTYIESEVDKFLEKYEDKNISISYGKDKNKFDTQEITKSLKKLRNKLINFGKFYEEYNKFMDNVVKFEYYKSEKEPGSVSPNQKKLLNKQMLNRLPILLTQIQAGNNSKSLKNELRQILYSYIYTYLYLLYRSKVLTKTVYNNLIKSIHA